MKADAAEDTEALNRALRHVNSDDVADEETGADTDAIDLSKRSHVLIVSERCKFSLQCKIRFFKERQPHRALNSQGHVHWSSITNSVNLVIASHAG